MGFSTVLTRLDTAEPRLNGRGSPVGLVLVSELERASVSPFWDASGVARLRGLAEAARSDLGLNKSLIMSDNGMSRTIVPRRMVRGLTEDMA